MPKENFEDWRIKNGCTQESTNAETLRELRNDHDSASMGEWKTGQHFQGSEILQLEMLRNQEHKAGCDNPNNQKEGSANNDSGCLRTMWINGENSETPRREEIKGYPLPNMPHGGSCECGNVGIWWKSEPEEVPRVASGVKDRVSRLKALGNGQVPRVVATAFKILTRDLIC